MVPLISEENQQSEAELHREQLLSHNSAGTEIQDEKGSRHVDSRSSKEEEPKPKKRRLRTGSQHEDVPQQNDFNQEEVLYEQQFLDQERNFVVVQVEADCSEIKEEQEDVYISQEGEQLGLKQEPQTFEDAPQLRDFKEEEVLTIQQLCNQERKFSLDQEEQDAAQVKEEEEELCTSQEEEHFGLKQETDTFMVTPIDEDNDKSESVPNSEQLLSHSSPDTESQDQGAGLAQHFQNIC
ncbi:uncharacterized protein KZ484_011000 [Pholidichthys leucotaenia]